MENNETQKEAYRISSQILHTRMVDLPLSIRAKVALATCDIDTLGDLLELRWMNLPKVRNCGTKTLFEVMALIESVRTNGKSAIEYGDFLTKSELCSRLKISKGWLQKLEKEGTIKPAIRVKGRLVRGCSLLYSFEDADKLEAYINAERNS